MTVHHIGMTSCPYPPFKPAKIRSTALFKSKPNVAQSQIDQFLAIGKSLVGKIPGLLSVELGKGLNTAAPVSKGFDWGLVVVLEGPNDLPVFEKHPAHAPFVYLHKQNRTFARLCG